MRVPAGQGACARPIQLKVGTANALTTLDADRANRRGGGEREVGVRVTGRALTLARMFRKAGLDVVGIQESRVDSGDPGMIGGYRVLSAPCVPGGRLGTQLWLRLGVPLGEGGSCRLEDRHLAVLRQDPRLLVVRCSAPFLRCIFAVVHAPSGHGSANAAKEARTYWRALSAEIGSLAGGDPVVLLMGANARVGSIRSPAVWGDRPCT